MKSSEIIILGIGTAGSRAAYYLHQLGTLEDVHIIAADSDADALATLPGVETVLLPPPDEAILENGELGQGAQNLIGSLQRYLFSARLMVLVTCLGRPTGNRYSIALTRFARENNLMTSVVAAMPHAFDEPDWHVVAKATIEQLKSAADTVLPLPNCEFGRLFPNQARAEAYPQSVRWIAETTIGFLALFTSRPFARGESKIRTMHCVDDDGGCQRLLEFKEMPFGIFGNCSKHTVLNGVNLDIPTFLREKIEIDDGR